MNDQTQPTTETEAVEAVEAGSTVRIRPDLTRYVPAKSSGGKRSHRKDDLVARCLSGKTVEEVKNGAKAFGIDADKWNHLNPGQQRMLAGNGLRALMNAKKEPLSASALVVVFGEPVAEFDPAAAAAEAALKAEAKEKAKADKVAVATAAAALAASKVAAIPPQETVDGDAAEGRVEAGRKARREARTK